MHYINFCITLIHIKTKNISSYVNKQKEKLLRYIENFSYKILTAYSVKIMRTKYLHFGILIHIWSQFQISFGRKTHYTK